MLVTSHTTKALRMVRSQIVPELRSLAVSLLENDLDSRMQLESAVSTIADRLSKTDAKSLEFDADGLRQERAKLLGRLTELRQQLANARSDEYRDVVVGGKAWSPSEAARKIVREAEINGWIPGPMQADIELTAFRWRTCGTLCHQSIHIARRRERIIGPSAGRPTNSRLRTDFQELLLERARLEQGNHEFRSDLWRRDRGPTSARRL